MSITIIQGDCREVLKTLPDESVHCVVTSPPYYGLRDYGTAKWEGGDLDCDHRAPDEAGKTSKPTSGQREHAGRFAGSQCHRCGAARIDSQIGLEPTPDAYIAEMVSVFREVRRVLRKDGTLWVVIGDSYAGSWGAQGRGGPPSDKSTLKGNGHVGGGPKVKGLSHIQIAAHPHKQSRTECFPSGSGLKPKDLIGIPWRLAFALQADGWWLRKDNIWQKMNPMPESCLDRTTSSHEYVFHFAKAEHYFYDAEAIKESAVSDHPSGNGFKRPQQISRGGRGKDEEWTDVGGTRNRRSVWQINTKPFPDAHFAVMPPDLAELCIKAGTSDRGCCPDCVAPWKRIVETEYRHHEKWFGAKQDARHSRGAAGVGYNEPIGRTTIGWEPACGCYGTAPLPKYPERPSQEDGEPAMLYEGRVAQWEVTFNSVRDSRRDMIQSWILLTTVPCIVLDPFFGAGTTGVVSQRLDRDCIGVELNPDYATMAERRIAADKASPLDRAAILGSADDTPLGPLFGIGSAA